MVDRTLKVVCSRGGDGTGGLELEDRKETEYHLPNSQVGRREAGSKKRTCCFDQDTLGALRILDDSDHKERRGCLEIWFVHHIAHPIYWSSCTWGVHVFQLDI